MIIGYARVSTDGQTLDAQQSALAAAGAERVFAEKISGAVTDRKAQAALSRPLVRGCVSHGAGSAGPKHQGPSKRPRCGRKAGAGFRSLADAWADTTTPHGRLMLTVLGGLAEFERELIRSRTDEGRKRAKHGASGSAASLR